MAQVVNPDKVEANGSLDRFTGLMQIASRFISGVADNYEFSSPWQSIEDGEGRSIHNNKISADLGAWETEHCAFEVDLLSLEVKNLAVVAASEEQ